MSTVSRVRAQFNSPVVSFYDWMAELSGNWQPGGSSVIFGRNHSEAYLLAAQLGVGYARNYGDVSYVVTSASGRLDDVPLMLGAVAAGIRDDGSARADERSRAAFLSIRSELHVHRPRKNPRLADLVSLLRETDSVPAPRLILIETFRSLVLTENDDPDLWQSIAQAIAGSLLSIAKSLGAHLCVVDVQEPAQHTDRFITPMTLLGRADFAPRPADVDQIVAVVDGEVAIGGRVAPLGRTCDRVQLQWREDSSQLLVINNLSRPKLRSRN